MRFPSSKYTKMRLRPGHCGSLQRSPDPLAAGGDGGFIAPLQNPTRSRPCGPRVFEFRPLASKKLCIPALQDWKKLDWEMTEAGNIHYHDP